MLRKLLTAVLLSCICVCGCCGALGESVSILFYFAGCELESGSGAGSSDLREILRAELPDCAQVFVLTGGSERWQIDDALSRRTSVLAVEDHGFRLLKQWDDLSCCSAKALTRYLRICAAQQPAEHCLLIFWGHGLGRLGVGYDRLNGSDILSPEEIREGILQSGMSVELIGFDACSMASLETVHALKDVCRYIVASPEPESLKGWPQHVWLRSATPDAEATGRLIVDSVNAGCGRSGEAQSLSLIDTQRYTRDILPMLTELFRAAPPMAHGSDLLSLGAAAENVEIYSALAQLLEGQRLNTGIYPAGELQAAFEIKGFGAEYGLWLERSLDE